MSYLVIENFVGGLDTRRHILTSKPGSAVKLVNAHITRGGEIEKRKIFELYKTLPAGTFGLETCNNILYTFGSADIGSQVPAGITYQRLRHPDLIFAMTKVVSFTSYNGKTFVIAEFEDGGRYGFYDGQIIPDFYNGTARASHGSINGLLNSLIPLFPEGYSATVLNEGLTITGPSGVEFSVSVSTSGTINSSPTVQTQTAVKGVNEVLAKSSFIIGNGTNGSGAMGRWLRYGTIASLPGITGMYIDGKEVLGLGSPVYWNTIPHEGGEYNEGPRMAYTLMSIIRSSNPTSGLWADYSYAKQSGTDSGYIVIYSDPIQGASANGKEIVFEFLGNPGTGSPLVYNPRISPYDTGPENPDPLDPPYVPTRYIATFGTFSGAVDNQITSVKIDGVEILGVAIPWRNSNSVTASVVADQINGYGSALDFVAVAIEGGKVQMTALPGTGSSLNGKIINTSTAGNVVIVSLVNVSGGVDPVGGVSQKTVIPFGGTFSVGSTITITITETENPENPIYVGATRLGGLKPAFCITFKTKVHVLAESYLISSGLDKPTAWKASDLGSSFIDMANNINGSQDLVSACSYQGKLAIFTRDTCQIWTIDVDAANNLQGQLILNSGCLAPYSVIGWGEVDVFYMSDSGIRSLRARDASNQAVVNDIGTPVDSEIIKELREHTVDEVFLSKSAIEPKDGRFLITIGEKLYVLSQFPASSILAWSTYEPGFSISNMCVDSGKLYVRSTDNKVYIYGGVNGNTYDNSPVTVELPYLDGTKPASQKHIQGVDMTSDGTWEFYLGTDTYNPEVRDFIATIDNPTLQVGRIPAYGIGTHIGVKLVGIGSGYCRVANIIVHYELNEAD